MLAASVILGVRATRPEFRIYIRNLSYCLEALSRQTYPIETLVIDYGSTLFYAKEIKEICDRYENVRRIGKDAKVWSRSDALNTGISASSGEITFLIDADCVLRPDYIEKHLESHAKNPNICTYSLVHDTYGTIEKSSDYDKLFKQKASIKPLRPGGMSHLGIRRSWFTSKGMFNPAYVGWGGEDDSLWHRIKKSGVIPVSVSCPPIHLWHPGYGTIMAYCGSFVYYKQMLTENRTRYYKELNTK